MGCRHSSVVTKLSDVYVVGQELGRGHFATVYAGEHKRNTTLVAIKFIRKDRTTEEQMLREVELLRRVGSHPAIVELYDTFDTEEHFQLVLEYVMGGELFEYLINNGAYTEQLASKHVRRIAEALNYLHGKSIVHCDLKPENILLTRADPTGQVKIADFGLARALHNSEKLRTVCGTWAYAAPEVMNGVGYDGKADMWSLGVIIFVLLSGYHPFDPDCSASEARIKAAIRAGNWNFDDRVWAEVSDLAKDLISKLLVMDQEARLSAAQVLQHPWVKGKAPRRHVSATIDQDLRAYRQRMRNKLRAGMLASLAITALRTGTSVRTPVATDPTVVDAGAAPLPTVAEAATDLTDVAVTVEPARV